MSEPLEHRCASISVQLGGTLRAILESWEPFHPLAPAVLEERALPVRPEVPTVTATAFLIVPPLTTEAFFLLMLRFTAMLLVA